MTLEELKEAYHSRPFKPFVIHLADGRKVPVVSREFMASGPSGRTIVVYQPDDRMHIIDLLLITDLEFRPSLNGTRRRGRR